MPGQTKPVLLGFCCFLPKIRTETLHSDQDRHHVLLITWGCGTVDIYRRFKLCHRAGGTCSNFIVPIFSINFTQNALIRFFFLAHVKCQHGLTW